MAGSTSQATVTVAGAARDVAAIVDLLRNAMEELNAGRWGVPAGAPGTFLEVNELSAGGGHEIQLLHLQLRRAPAGLSDLERARRRREGAT